jgi:hypothetical protein
LSGQPRLCVIPAAGAIMPPPPSTRYVCVVWTRPCAPCVSALHTRRHIAPALAALPACWTAAAVPAGVGGGARRPCNNDERRHSRRAANCAGSLPALLLTRAPLTLTRLAGVFVSAQPPCRCRLP